MSKKALKTLRTHEEINKEYNQEISLWGHKMATLALLEDESSSLNQQCEAHLSKSKILRREAQVIAEKKPDLEPKAEIPGETL